MSLIFRVDDLCETDLPPFVLFMGYAVKHNLIVHSSDIFQEESDERLGISFDMVDLISSKDRKRNIRIMKMLNQVNILFFIDDPILQNLRVDEYDDYANGKIYNF